MKDQNLPVPAAGRTLQLLEFIVAHSAGVTPQECLTHLDITRSSLFSLLQTLTSLGYIDHLQTRGPYTPGPRLLAWRAFGWAEPQELILAFYQETASTSLDETLALAVSAQLNITLIAQRESPHHVRTSFSIGFHYSHKETAAGPVLDSTPSKSILRNGYHLQDSSEAIELALPICQDGYTPNAALLLSAPRHRHTKETILATLPALRDMAARLSYRLGAAFYAPYQGPALPRIEPTSPLSEEEIMAFLQGPWIARLACVRPDGKPHVIPVWHEFVEGRFYVASWGGSKWADYLLANPRVSLTIDEPWAPMRRISAQGFAQPLSNDNLPGGISTILNRLSLRFLGQPLSTEMASQPWQAFYIQPEQVRGWRGIKPPTL